MNEIHTFTFHEKNTRYIVNDEPWITIKDVATIFEYNDTKHAIANNVFEDDRKTF